MSLSAGIHYKQGDFTLEAHLETKGGITALFGPSGAGKTTFLNCLCGLAHPDKGHIRLNSTLLLHTEKGINIPTHRRHIGYVFQSGRLFPHMTVRDNLFYGWREQRHKEEILSTLELTPLLHRRPAGLSGGERQRVALGRTLLSAPRLVLMDEPLASLDALRRGEIFPLLEKLCYALSLPIIYVSHNGRELMRLADSIALMSHGRITAHEEALKILNRPEMWHALDDTDTTAPTTIFAGEQEGKSTDGLMTLRIPGGHLHLPLPPKEHRHKKSLRVCIHARDVLLSTAPPQGLSIRNALKVRLQTIKPLTHALADVKLHLQNTPADTPPLWARVTRAAVADMNLREGLELYALIKTAALYQKNTPT